MQKQPNHGALSSNIVVDRLLCYLAAAVMQAIAGENSTAAISVVPNDYNVRDTDRLANV
jgi:hypothetical protein